MSGQQQPTNNQLKGYMLKHCIDYCNGLIDEGKLLAVLRIAKEKWGHA